MVRYDTIFIVIRKIPQTKLKVERGSLSVKCFSRNMFWFLLSCSKSIIKSSVSEFQCFQLVPLIAICFNLHTHSHMKLIYFVDIAQVVFPRDNFLVRQPGSLEAKKFGWQQKRLRWNVWLLSKIWEPNNARIIGFACLHWYTRFE